MNSVGVSELFKELDHFPSTFPHSAITCHSKKMFLGEIQCRAAFSKKIILNLIHYSENNYDSIVSLVDCTVVHKCKVGKILDTFLRHTAIQYLVQYYYFKKLFF